MELREMRPTDLVKLTKLISPMFIYGQVAEVDGEIVGGGCVVYGRMGRPWACLHGSDDVKVRPVTVVKAMIAGLKECQKHVPEIYAMQENERLLKWLGFKETGEEIDGHKVMKWKQ